VNWPLFAGILVASIPVVVWQIRRAARSDAEPGPAPAAPRSTGPVIDTRPGTNVAAQDACELLWSLPAYDPDSDDLAAGLDRLRAAIDEQKGEQA
jgi:hypothetical protein